MKSFYTLLQALFARLRPVNYLASSLLCAGLLCFSPGSWAGDAPSVSNVSSVTTASSSPTSAASVETAKSGTDNKEQKTPDKNPPSKGAPFLVQVMVFGVTLLVLLVSLAVVKSSLRRGKWSLAHALSEEVTLTAEGAASKASVPNGSTPAATPAVQGGDTATPKTETTQMVGSASRLIAFLGMLVILAFFVGVGLWLLWELLSKGVVPTDLDRLLNFFAGGATLFVPYLANQFKAMLGNLTK